MSSPRVTQCSCKVGRTTEKYELTKLDNEIVHRREQDDESLRDLAEFVNTQILDRAIEKHADRDVLIDVESMYSKLTNGVDVGKSTELRERLASTGVPIREVTDDFVSHQTVRSHLKTCLDMDTSRSRTTDLEEVANLIEWARNRDEQIINRALARLHESGDLDVEEPNVIHSIRVICGNCGKSHRLRKLLDNGGCVCGGSD